MIPYLALPDLFFPISEQMCTGEKKVEEQPIAVAEEEVSGKNSESRHWIQIHPRI